ncbi:AMP-binding protein [Nonomuraea purpurea]|uniref:AMP-binding protein n=1 Tax=Nonomuraea purpurea TaxID=1849276 RepID=A0ABV8FYZ3_9ACTN
MTDHAYWPPTAGEPTLDTTLGDLLRDAAATVPDRLALVDGSAEPSARREWTYRELLQDAERVARALLSRYAPGDRIAVWSANRPEWELLQLGAALAGMVLVTVNPALRERELRHVLGQSRACALFLTADFRGERRADVAGRLDLPELRERYLFEDWAAFLALAEACDVPFPDVKPRDAAQIQYTSGTTGAPKGCRLHHQGSINAARFAGTRGGLRDGDIWINPMPMFHVGSCVMAAIGILALHGTHVLLPRFDATLVLDRIQEHRGTIMLAVPTILNALVNHPRVEEYDLSSMRSMLLGGAGCPAALVRRAESLFDCTISIGFGQTEVHGVVTQTHPADSFEDRMTTVGHPLPHMEARILDPVTGRTVRFGERGEICVRGYQSMLDYFELPEASRATLDADGWLHTGDLGSMDERGFIRVTGRLKDMIIRGGENIYPREIEELLLTHPGVSGAEVLGVPDEHWGEQVAVVLQLRPGPTRAEELYRYCRENLAPFKAPRLWYLTEDFPVTASGKIQKYVLRRRIADGDLKPVLSMI